MPSIAQFRGSKLVDAPVDVLVHHGRVQVAGGAPPIVLEANMQMALAGAARPREISPDAATRALAWRDGKLAFEGETLAQAAQAFARYSDTRLEIADAALAREPVSGLFAADDAVGFAQAVAQVFDARADQRGRRAVLSRPASSDSKVPHWVAESNPRRLSPFDAAAAARWGQLLDERSEPDPRLGSVHARVHAVVTGRGTAASIRRAGAGGSPRHSRTRTPGRCPDRRTGRRPRRRVHAAGEGADGREGRSRPSDRGHSAPRRVE